MGSHSDADAIAMETIPLLPALSVCAEEHSSPIITVASKQHWAFMVQAGPEAGAHSLFCFQMMNPCWF